MISIEFDASIADKNVNRNELEINMTPINLNAPVNPLVSSITNKVLSILQENKIVIVALLAIGLVALVWVSLRLRSMNGKSEKEESLAKELETTQEKLKAFNKEKETSINNLQGVIENLKKEKETLEKLVKELEQKLEKSSLSQSEGSKISVNPADTSGIQAELKSAQKKLEEAELQIKALNDQLAKVQKQYLDLQKLKSSTNSKALKEIGVDYEKKIKALNDEIALLKQSGGQNQADPALLIQLKDLLSKEPKALNDKLFKTLQLPEAQKLYAIILRSNELQRLANTKQDKLSEYQPKKGVEESKKLSTLFKTLLLDIKSEKEKNGILEKKNNSLSERNENLKATLVQRSQKSGDSSMFNSSAVVNDGDE